MSLTYTVFCQCRFFILLQKDTGLMLPETMCFRVFHKSIGSYKPLESSTPSPPWLSAETFYFSKRDRRLVFDQTSLLGNLSLLTTPLSSSSTSPDFFLPSTQTSAGPKLYSIGYSHSARTLPLNTSMLPVDSGDQPWYSFFFPSPYNQ